MAPKDSGDDTIRFVISLGMFDLVAVKIRVEVASFDDAAEAPRCFPDTHPSVVGRRTSGDANSRDHVAMLIKEPRRG
jgi:hypothetical protein